MCDCLPPARHEKYSAAFIDSHCCFLGRNPVGPRRWLLLQRQLGSDRQVRIASSLRRVAMKSWIMKSGFLAIVFIGTLHVVGACGVDWRVPTNHFDGVNEWGKLSYWRQIGKIDLGDNLEIPLIIGFNPTRGDSPYLGRGWMISILESNIVQVDESKFLLTQPDGISRQFWRGKPTDTVLQGQGGWKGEIKDNSITVWAECGWKLVFNRGKITSIATPKNRIINLVYTNGRVSEIQEQGRTVLRVESDLMSGRVNGLTYGTNHIGIELGDKPKVETIQGLNVVAGSEQSLHKLAFANGTQAIYDFGVDEKLQPTLKVSGDASRQFVWNPMSGKAVQDGEWAYDIKPTDAQYTNAAISRTNSKSQTEFWYLDKEKGVETVKRLDGIQRITNRYTSGQLAGKIRDIREIENGVTRTILKNSYDEMGRPIRSTNELGIVQVLHYDNAGHFVKNTFELDSRPDAVERRNAKEKELLHAIEIAPNKYKKDTELRSLAGFYIYSLHTPEKASELAKQISSEGERLSVLLISLNTNSALGNSEKQTQCQTLIASYPAKTDVILAAMEKMKYNH
jgi:hypothetical protein